MNSIQEPGKLIKRKAKEINLKEIFSVLQKRIWVVIVITLLTSLLGAYHSYTTNIPMYQSSSRIIIGADPEYRNTLQVIMKDSTVLSKVVEELNLQVTPEQLASQITVASVDNSQVVSISVTDNNANRAAKIANTTAKVFKQEIPIIVGFDKVTFLSDAKVNPWPINQTQNRTILIAAVIGVVIGIGLVFLLDSLDDSIRVEKDIEEILGLPVLGKVSKTRKNTLKRKKVKQFNSRGGSIGF